MANDRETGPKYSSENGRIVETERGGRLARLLPQSDYRSDEDRRRRAFLLEHAYRFDDEFSEQYQKIRKLPGIKPGNKGEGGVPDDDLRFEIGEIVYKYLRRYNSKAFWKNRHSLPPEAEALLYPDDYFENLRKCMHDAEAAAPLLEAVMSGLAKLDADHWSLLLQLKARMTPTIVDTSYETFLARLSETRNVMVAIQGFMELAIGNALPSGERGHPRARYVLPAAELLVLWFRLTGQPPVTTTTREGKDFVRPSTEFTKLCLTMIEPTISMANVATSITRALDALDYMIESAGDRPIKTNRAFWLLLEQAIISKEKSKK
jgi:hypothetical protein